MLKLMGISKMKMIKNKIKKLKQIRKTIRKRTQNTNKKRNLNLSRRRKQKAAQIVMMRERDFFNTQPNTRENVDEIILVI